MPSAYAARRTEGAAAVDPQSALGQALDTRRTAQTPDLTALESYRNGHPGIRAIADLAGAHTLQVPLVQDQTVTGFFTFYRTEVRAFSDKQVALLENFAAQAVIAMENARLLGELRERTAELAERNTAFAERIEHQAATIDVLQAMAASPGDPQPVFDLIARRARELCNGALAGLFEVDGDLLQLRASSSSGNDAIALAMAPHFSRANLRRPVHILLSYDEETTCLGSVDFIARFGKDLPRPAAVIVGEPTMMEVVDAHKSIATFRTIVTGFEAHSSKPALGANAVQTACEIVAEIAPAGVTNVTMHDGSVLRFTRVPQDYDVTDRQKAFAYLKQHPNEIVTGVLFRTDLHPELAFVVGAMSLILGLFATMTVIVDDRAIEARFGVGIVRKRVPFDRIRSCRVVRNPWYFGWGIHLFPGGVLYNASGLDAIELGNPVGSAFPDALLHAVLFVLVAAKLALDL